MYLGLASHLVKHACVVIVIQMMILAHLSTMSVGHRPCVRACFLASTIYLNNFSYLTNLFLLNICRNEALLKLSKE